MFNKKIILSTDKNHAKQYDVQWVHEEDVNDDGDDVDDDGDGFSIND